MATYITYLSGLTIRDQSLKPSDFASRLENLDNLVVYCSIADLQTVSDKIKELNQTEKQIRVYSIGIQSITLNSKLDLIGNVLEKNPFQSEYFLWVDWTQQISRYVPTEKIKLISRTYTSKSFIKTHGMSSEAFILSFFGGNLENMKWFVQQNTSESETEFIHRLYLDHSDRFLLTYSDYPDVRDNLEFSRKGLLWVINYQMNMPRDLGDHSACVVVGKYLWPKRHLMNRKELTTYLDEYFISLYFTQQDYQEVGAELLELIDFSPEYDRIRSNLDCLKITAPAQTVTLITGIYQISEESRKTLNYPVPMIIYTKPELVDQIREIRKDFDSQIIERKDDKFVCLSDAVSRNPFQTNRFVWVDPGTDFSKERISPEIGIVMREYKSFGLEFISGNSTSIQWCCQLIKEEKDISKIWEQNKDRFDLYYGNEYRKITNLILKKARLEGDYQAGRVCAEKLWEYRSEMTPLDRLTYLDEYLVVLAMAKDGSKIKTIGEELLGLIDLAPTTERPRIEDNLRLIGLKTAPCRITLVTSFYDLAKRDKTEARLTRRSPKTYLELAEKKTLAIPEPMVIYCDPEYSEQIRKIRSRLTSAPTEIISKRFEKMEYEKYREKVTESIMKGKTKPLREKYPWKITPDYCLVTWSKFACLADVIKRNPFKTSRIAWMDFGMGYLTETNPDFGKYFPEYLPNFTSKIKITQRWYVNKNVVSKEDFFVSEGFAFTGGFFGGGFESITWLKEKIDLQIESLLKDGWALLEEQMIARIYVDNPDRFELSYGNYCNLIDNLNQINQGHRYVSDWMMNKARTVGSDLATSRRVGEKLWTVRDKIKGEDLLAFLDEYFIASIGYPDFDLICSELIQSVKSYSGPNKENISRIKDNLKLVGKAIPDDLETIGTFVTAFYDLSKRDKTKRRTPEEYLEYSRLTLGLKQPMVIYCDPEYADRIRAIRGFPELTKIIAKPFEEFKDLQEYQTRVQEIYSNGHMNQLIKHIPHKFTPNYCLVTWSKFSCLANTIRFNPFQTEKIIWIDFGLQHLKSLNPDLSKYFPESLKSIGNRIKLVERCHPVESDVSDFRNNPHTAFCFCAGIFGGSLENMSWFRDEFRKEVEKTLSDNLAPLEEQIFTRIYLNYPDSFDVSYGDYQYILDNLEFPYQGHGEILKWVMSRARTLGNCSASRLCGEQIWKVRDQIPKQHRVNFLDEYFISVYSTTENDPEKRKDCLVIGQELIDTLSISGYPAVLPQNETEQNYLERIRNNLGLVGLQIKSE